MPSKRRLAPVVGRDGISTGSSREQEVSTVELDTTFGRLLGLADGQKVYTPSAHYYPRGVLTLAGWTVHSSGSTNCAYNQH